jgi:transglutaminase-like putative cysteine protease
MTPPPGRVDRRWRLVEIGVCTAAGAVTVLPYAHFYADHVIPLSLFAASVLGSAAAALGGLRRWGAGRNLLAGLTGLPLLYPVMLVASFDPDQNRPVAEVIADTTGALLYGFGRLFSVNLPADVTPDTLAAPLLGAWTSAFLAMTAVCRARSATLPVLPILFGYGFALAVANPTTPQTIVTLLCLGLSLALILMRTNAELRVVTPTDGVAADRRLGRLIRRGVPMLAVVLVVSIVAGQAQQLATGQDRADPRSALPREVKIRPGVTPLAVVKSQRLEDPPRLLFTVEPRSGDLAGGLIRTVVLDSFDGRVWTTGDRFLVAGRQLTRELPLTGERAISFDVVVDGLSGQFLPVVGRPVRLAQTTVAPHHELGYSGASGVLVDAKSSSAGLRYRLSALPIHRDDRLAAATPIHPTEQARYTDLPSGNPGEVQALARDVGASTLNPYRRLVRAEAILRARPYDPRGRSGHSYAAVARLISAGRSGHGHAEQRAAAFAVLARSLRYPTRIAVGYRVPDPVVGPTRVTTRAAHAWAEVYFAGHGWVPFDPTDETRSVDEPEPPDTGLVPTAKAPPPTPTVVPSRPPLPTTGEGGGRSIAVVPPGPNVALLVAIGVALLIALAVGVVVGGKARRRWVRRRAPTGADRIVGAWREALDRCVEHGLTRSPSDTAFESVARAEARFGDRAGSLRALAPLVTVVLYAGLEPSEVQIGVAWILEGRLHRGLCRGRAAMLRRLRARVDPRPLVPVRNGETS